jgi:outer membrane protein TolC
MYPLKYSKNKQKRLGSLMLFCAFTCSLGLFAQKKTSDTMSMTLSQAIDYAMTNNPDLKNAYADIAIADQTVKEIKAIGIPQVRGQINFQDAIQKQVFVFPINGVGTPIRIGNTYTTD